MIDEHMAMTGAAEGERTRILLFGMECAFTAPIAELLLATPVAQVTAIVLARTAPVTPTAGCPRMSQLAIGKGVPIVELSDRNALRSDAFLSTLADFDSDLIVVACFPWRLPPVLVSLPKIASLNIHPSLLPDGRGPEPIFWAFRRGLDWTGVTLHLMDDGLDTGPIVDRRQIAIPGDATMITLERSLAHTGAELLREFLLGRSSLVSAWPQAAGAGDPAPFPDAGDLLVTTAWNASAAARFIDAASPVYGFIEVLVLATGQRLAVVEVLGIEERAPTTPAVLLQDDFAWIDFADGRMHCRLRTQRQRLAFGL